MEICIIGAGFSGIAACKQALSHNLVPFILERNSDVGGIWQGFPNQAGVWDSLHTNSTKQMMWFSDHPWPSSDPEYPSKLQVCQYLASYISKHNLSQYISTGSEVKSIEKESDLYRVKWVQQDTTYEKTFKYVIVASGKYSKNHKPFENFEEFKGEIIYAGDYRDPEVFRDKHVVVVGKSFSSCDIAAEAVDYAKSVTQIFKRPTLLMEKFVNGIPFEYDYYNMKTVNTSPNLLSTLERNSFLCKTMINLLGNPGLLDPSLELEESHYTNHFVPFVIISEKYKQSLQNHKITCIKSTISHFSPQGLLLQDGAEIKSDLIILGCGYQTDYSFLSPEIQQIIKYDEQDQLAPTILYRSIFHPDLQGLAFVGNFIYGAPGHFELQAEVAVRHVLGILNISDEEVNEGLLDELNVRENYRELKSVYNFWDYGKEMMRILGITIDLEFLREIGWEQGVVLPSFLYLEKDEMRRISVQVVKEIRERFNGYMG